MTKFIGNCLTCACLLALAACAADSPKTTSNENQKRPAVRDLSNQPQGNTRMMDRQPH